MTAKALDSRMAHHGKSLRPGGLQIMPGVCVCMPKISRGEWRKRVCGVTILPRMIFLFLSLFGKHRHLAAKISLSKKELSGLIFIIFEEPAFYFH